MKPAEPKDHYWTIYQQQAAAYHHMIEAEDVEGNLPKALLEIADPAGKKILDAGTGTGRIPLMLSHRAKYVLGFDLQAAMLGENQRRRAANQGSWDLVQADLRAVPLLRHNFELVFSAWAIGHLLAWQPMDWPFQVNGILRELNRVTKPGGKVIIIETLGTGTTVPKPPNKNLAAYYQLLEAEWGFNRREISTDYLFESVEAALESMTFFFGQALGAEILKNRWCRVPEWTGIWFRQC